MKHLLLIFLVLFSIISCEKDPELPALTEVTTGDAEDVNATCATVVVEIENNSPSSIGVLYGTSKPDSYYDAENYQKTSTIVLGTNELSLSSLEANTTYYYRAYAASGGIYIYGKIRSFTTASIYSIYDSISSSQKEQVFYDGFSDNSNDWGTTTTSSGYTITREVKSGYYYLDYNRDGYGGFSYLTIDDFNPTKNFEIEAKVKQYYSYSTSSSDVGVLWGASSDKRFFRIAQNEGEFYTGDKTDDGWNAWSGWEDFEQINIDNSDYNILTVRKINSTYYFFINHYLAYTYSNATLSSSENIVGFWFAECTAYVDYVRVCQLNL